MKYIIVVIFCILTCCSNDTSDISFQELESFTASETSIPKDTIFIFDTIEPIDTFTLFDTIKIIDTIEAIDTLKITKWKEDFNKCKTVFDSAIVPQKALFWGNFLLGGFGQFGMSASNDTLDYFAHIKHFFDEKIISFEASKIAGNYENIQNLQEKQLYINDVIYPLISDSTNLVVIQLGDNVNEEQEFIIFKDDIDFLLDHICGIAKNAKVLWIGEWYASAPKQKILKEEAEKFGVTFIDISDLNIPSNQSYVGAIIDFPNISNFSMTYDSYIAKEDSLEISFYYEDSLYTSTIKIENYSDDSLTKTISWEGNQFIVPNSGIATHPNDKAFKEIADRILIALGYD